jgi:hypothetical protein
MDSEKLENIINIISRGETSSAELLFERPGGRKYFETIILAIISTSPYAYEEKIDLFSAFLLGLDKIERRVQHQKEGEKILRQVYC